MRWLSTERIGQISGSETDAATSDPQGWPLLNDTRRWGALGFDECANTEHQGRLYFFSGDVECEDSGNNPFNNSDLVAWTEDTEVLSLGGHRAMGFDFCLPHDIGEDANHQANWRFCIQCGGLFFDGYSDKGFEGVCPKGGRHVPAGFHFVLPHDTGEDDHNQSNWHYCLQCGGLFFDGYADKGFEGVCPKGGKHVPAGYNFVLPHEVTEDANNQAHWRYCVTCAALFWDGDSNKGLCAGAKPGGGFHLRCVRQNDGLFWSFEADPPLGILLSNEMAVAAFSYGGRVYLFCGVAQAHWSGQTRLGDPAYGLYLVSTDQPDQPVPYRKEFLFNPRLGVCSSDGGSHDVLGYNFVLPFDSAGSPSRPLNWLCCRKCASLFQGDATLQGGSCQSGGRHEANSIFYALPQNSSEDSLNQGNWRRCQKCEEMFWYGYYPNQGVCPVDHGKHELADQINYVLPHDQSEDSHHQDNWRRCLKCNGMFWDGRWTKGSCPAGDTHSAEDPKDPMKCLQDELILAYDVSEDSNNQANWRFCTQCFGMFFDGYAVKGVCPVRNPDGSKKGHIGGVHNFVLPHDIPVDRWHQSGWCFCHKCNVLFFVDVGGGRCPFDGGSHEAQGYQFVLPHRIWQDSGNDRDWRFCTKCFAMVSTKSPGKFWTVASVVVTKSSKSNSLGLPVSQSGDGLVILGYGWDDFYLAWMPLGSSSPKLQETLYLGPSTIKFLGHHGVGRAPVWYPSVEKARGLFGTSLLADPDHISMAWLDGPQCWILLYSRGYGDGVPGPHGVVVARIGETPWSWGQEILIASRALTGELYEESFTREGTWPYGPYILNRFTEWNETTRELGIYYLLSFSRGYQIHLMYTRLSLPPRGILEWVKELANGILRILKRLSEAVVKILKWLDPGPKRESQPRP
jgi:hypothetical protein